MVGVDVSKTCKPKNLRRAILALLLIAPLVYLFGTQFFALAGAHGEEVLAVEQKELNTDVVIDGVTYKRQWAYSTWALDTFHEGVEEFYLGSNDYAESISYYCDYLTFTSLIDVDYEFVEYYLAWDDLGYFDEVVLMPYSFVDFFLVADDSHFVYCAFAYGDELMFASYLDDNTKLDSLYWSVYSGGDELNISDGYSICFDLELLNYSIGSYSKSDVISLLPYEYPLPKVDENYSDTLQNHFFNQDNWVSSIGKDVYVGEEVGFKPIGDMIRFIDDNALHLKDTEWGNFIAGYAYYCANVIFVYECFVLCVMFITIPTKVLDYFHKED